MTVFERAVEPAPPDAPSVWDELKRALSPIEERPRIVSSLESRHFTTRGGEPYVMICNPRAFTYLRLDPREFDLLPLMDGSRTLKALVVAYYQRHGVLALPRISGLVRLLRAHRFLVDPPQDAYLDLEAQLAPNGAQTLATRLMHGFLQSELPLPGMDALFAAWFRSWGWVFFTRSVVVIAAILGLLSPLLFLVELNRDRYTLFQIGGSYMLGFVVITGLGMLALVFHEIGHGLAVKFAGRRISRAGLMLYYGMPAGFVDTTDVWMAPLRQRLLVLLAGPWSGLVLGGLCALGAILLPEGLIGGLLFVWSFVFLVDNLFNFNPLLELDGYYMLSDLVEKPMLRARAMGFVRGPLWSKLRRRERLNGEERFFALFGLASIAYSAMAVVLAIRFWQQRLQPLVGEAWASGQPLEQVAAVLLVALVAIPLLFVVLLALRVVLRAAERGLNWLSGQAAVRRHREALDALQAVPLWADLPEQRLLDVASAMGARDVSSGTEVVRQGEPGDRFYVIAQGTFEVLVDRHPVARLGRGDYFGERALLHDAPRAATVMALGSGRVFWLDQPTFRATLAHDLATRERLETALSFRADVADVPLFRELAPAEFDLLLARLTLVTYPPGATIVQQGQDGERFYVVRSGRAEVVRDGQVLSSLGPGDAFGEIALLHDVPTTASVVARRATELLALSESDFRDLLVGYCGQAGALERLSHLRLQTHCRLDQLLGR